LEVTYLHNILTNFIYLQKLYTKNFTGAKSEKLHVHRIKSHLYPKATGLNNIWSKH